MEGSGKVSYPTIVPMELKWRIWKSIKLRLRIRFIDFGRKMLEVFTVGSKFYRLIQLLAFWFVRKAIFLFLHDRLLKLLREFYHQTCSVSQNQCQEINIYCLTLSRFWQLEILLFGLLLLFYSKRSRLFRWRFFVLLTPYWLFSPSLLRNLMG